MDMRAKPHCHEHVTEQRVDCIVAWYEYIALLAVILQLLALLLA